jgi:hypothetical protein
MRALFSTMFSSRMISSVIRPHTAERSFCPKVVDHTPVERTKDLLVRLARVEDDPDRTVASRERFGKRHHVWNNVPVLTGKKLSRSTETGLNFVGYQKGAITRAYLPGPREKVGRRKEDAMPFNRLHHKRGDVAPGDFRFKTRCITERDFRAPLRISL